MTTEKTPEPEITEKPEAEEEKPVAPPEPPREILAGHIAQKAALRAQELGAGTVIVMVALPAPDENGDDAVYVAWRGKPLSIRGLLEICIAKVRGHIQ